MKGFDTLKVKSGVKNHNDFNLSCSHLTTMNFGEIVPLYAEELVPGDKFHINANFFSRMAPLVKPTYGKFQFKTVSAFVPYHQLAYDAEAWFAGKTTWQGVTPVFRYFTVGDLCAFIRDYCSIDNSADPTIDATNCDWGYRQANGNTVYCKFTTVGKYYIKILNSLGYAVPQNPYYLSSSTWYNVTRLYRLSAYPLLAFAKLYNDYMSQSQRFNTSALSQFLLNVKNNVAQGSLYAATGQIQSMGILQILSNIKLNYENDYFTSAWQSANNPLATGESVSSANVPTPYEAGTNVGSVLNDTILTIPDTTGATSYTYIGQRALDFLKSFDDWVRRNNYSGSREVQQIYSRFGIKPDDYRAHYAHVISTDSVPIQVGDVTSNASTDITTSGGATSNIKLGDYAGKGIMNSNEGISYDSSDYGILLVLGYFTVAPMNSYGFDRKVLRNSPLDYYNPEFDGIGADAIPIMELFENPLGTAEADTTQDLGVFGFTERYNSYRFGRDKITGEFRDYRNANPMNVWHSGRLLNAARKAGLVAQSSTMNTFPQSASEFNRIFSVTDGSVDTFYLTAQFDVKAIRPMMSLNQVPRLGQGDTVVPRNGNVIS